MVRAHQALKKDAKGYVGATRFVCKAEWDVYVWFRFANLEALKGFLGSEFKQSKFDPIVNELNALSISGKTHSQNFVADDW